jgi:hypothetical protein
MKDPTALPLALYRANSELQSRLAELVQDSALMWLEFGQRMINEGLVDGSSDVQEMLRTQDWQKLLSLPADAFWRQLQQRFGDHQAAAEIALAAQAGFAQGVQEALQAWQRDTVAALDEAGLASAAPAFDPAWANVFEGWDAWLHPHGVAAAGASDGAARRPATRHATAAKKKPPAKKAPSRSSSTSGKPARH